MKKLVFAIVFGVLLCSTDGFGQKSMTVKEFFYQVDEDGTIHKDKILGERIVKYTAGRGATKVVYGGDFRHDLKIREVEKLDFSISLLSKKKKHETVYDDNKRLIEFTEYPESNTTIKHVISYNQYDDPVTIKSEIQNGNGAPTRYSTVTFEYFYFDDYPVINFSDEEINRFYKTGLIKSKQGSPWMIRTIKKDDIVIQYIERKIRN